MKSPKELPKVLELILKKFELLIQNKSEIINQKYEEVLACINQKNLDSAKLKMKGILKFEKNIEAIIILKPILERIQKNCASMLSKKECPISLRPPLDSVLYASTRLHLSDLKNLKEIIIQMYGADYVKNAINDEDKIVNQDLISKLNWANITEETINERLINFIKGIQVKTNKKEEDDMFGKTVGNTININQISSDTIPEILIQRLKLDDDPFGGDTIKTIDLTNLDADKLKKDENQIEDPLGGDTYKTMQLSVANPDNKSNPYEESLDDLFGPTIEPVPSGRTLGLNISLKLGKGKENNIDPFDKNDKDKIKDPFGDTTIKLEGDETL